MTNFPTPESVAEDNRVKELEQELLTLRRQLKQHDKKRTALLWLTGNANYEYFISEEDLTEFDNCYINWIPYDCDDHENYRELQIELVDVMAGVGHPAPLTCTKKRWLEAIACGAKLVVAGIIE